MFKIDNIDYELTSKDIFIGRFKNNGVDGYTINICLKFINIDKVSGYLNISAGFELDKDINIFLNRVYDGIPYDNDKQYIYFECFNTKKFLDTEIESNLHIEIIDKKDNSIRVTFRLDDELLNLRFDDYLNIIEKIK